MAAESKLGLRDALVFGAQGGSFRFERFGFSVLGVDLAGVGFDAGESSWIMVGIARSVCKVVPCRSEFEHLAIAHFDFPTGEFSRVEEDTEHQKVHPPTFRNTPFGYVSI